MILWHWWVKGPVPKLVHARAQPAIYSDTVGSFLTFGMKFWSSYSLSFQWLLLADLVSLVSRCYSFHSQILSQSPTRPWPVLSTVHDFAATSSYFAIVSPRQNHWPSTQSTHHRGTQGTWESKLRAPSTWEGHSTHLAMLHLPFFYGAIQDSDFLPKSQMAISVRTLLLLEFILNYPMPLCLRANPEEVKRIHDYNFLPILSSPLLSSPLLSLPCSSNKSPFHPHFDHKWWDFILIYLSSLTHLKL